MYCTQCGAHNPDEAKYCYQCGTALPDTVDSLPPPVVEQPIISTPPAPPPPPPIEYAGFWRRFLALIIDGLILGIPSGLIAFLFVVPVISAMVQINADDITASTIIGTLTGLIWVGMFILLLRLAYWTLFECSKFQATPGKMALGIIVTDMEGRRITLARSLGRNLGKVISHLVLNIGFLMAGLSQKKQALHDMLADCLVVMR